MMHVTAHKKSLIRKYKTSALQAYVPERSGFIIILRLQ